MPWINTPNGRSVTVLVGVMLVSLGLAGGMQLTGLHPPFAVRLLLGLAVMAAGVWALCRYWRTVDEVGREAQKWAWFWGGSIGLALGAMALSVVTVGAADLVPEGGKPATLLFYGAGIMVAAQMIGFLAAWAYWWAKRR